MASSLLMRRGLGLTALVCVDRIGQEILAALPFETEFFIKITQPRNVKHHRKFFALLNEVYHNQTGYSTLENMLDDIKIGIGHADKRTSITGIVYYVPRSISFATMDQIQFTQFYDKVVGFILTTILPHTDRADLEQRIYDILGEPGPASLSR